jgi:hypothetical protein
VLHATAGEVAVELVEDEPRQRSFAFGKAALEGREVLFNEAREDGLFRAMALIAHRAGDR